MQLLLTYLLPIMGAFGLWQLSRSSRPRSSSLSLAQQRVAEFQRHLAMLGAWSFIAVGGLQVLAGYGDPFAFLAGPLDGYVLLALAALLAVPVKTVSWLWFGAGPAELTEFKGEVGGAKLSPRAYRIFATAISLLILPVFVLLVRTSTGSGDPRPAKLLPESVSEAVGAAVFLTFLLGGLFWLCLPRGGDGAPESRRRGEPKAC